MRNLDIYLKGLLALGLTVNGLKSRANLRDLHAFPKYAVEFLNHAPLASTDADLIRSGVPSESIFLEPRVSSGRHLSDGRDVIEEDRLEVIPMSLNTTNGVLIEYLCLLPGSNTTRAQTDLVEANARVEEEEELDPSLGWAALSHLEGRCLYLKQGWFTYSYCHNSHIRQFREARHTHPHPPGGYTPEEDPTYDAYTLGQAPSVKSIRKPHHRHNSLDPNSSPNNEPNSQTNPDSSQKQSEKSISRPAEQPKSRSEVSYGLNTRSRYLVQRWTDGTRCDKTGRPRETEVQIHCGMTSTDVIYMIKELAICQYVLVVHSPHLCGLPGFKAEEVKVESAPIRCREVLSDDLYHAWEEGKHVETNDLGIGEGLPQPEGGTILGLPEMIEKDSEENGKEDIKVMMGDLSDDLLSRIFGKAMEALSSKVGEDGKSEESMGENKENLAIFDLEENEEGVIYLDADILLGGEQGQKMGDKDKEEFLKVVRKLLNEQLQLADGKGEKEEGQSHDEL
ncbi:hypothetical protein M231_01773 [Tremella mesenterica]|uniref:Protein OS-9 homolog n=1 Tax=Tremella mesenterica TaxID=5217 RepID=A0A4Q1BSC2_TREME|nr:hypothetical protein M231_01773 [Tremella mesenterica]